MRNYLHITAFALLCMFSLNAHAQDHSSLPLDTINGKVYYHYTVERSIGLYRISVNFGVSQEEILKANPHLQTQGLRYGEVILIPTNITVEQEHSTPKPKAKERKEKVHKPSRPLVRWGDTPVDTVAVDTLLADTLVLQDSILMDSVSLRLAIMLPLHADMVKREKSVERFYDFYAGALIAIYEAQSRGMQLEIFTYDVGKTTNAVKNIFINHPEIHTMDGIIGPAYSQQVATAVDSIRGDSTWLLVPFISNVASVKDHPFVLQFNPSDQCKADTVARYLAARADSVNCVLVEPKPGEVIPASIATLREALNQYNVPQTTISLRALLTDSLGESFVAEKENIIIFNTEKFNNLQMVMPHLDSANVQYPITLYSHYSWEKEQFSLPRLYTSIFPPIKVSENYDALYREYFDHPLASEQPRYDLLGYDLTGHLLHMLAVLKNNDGLSTEIPTEQVWEGIQSQIQYHPVGENGGLENQMIHIIHQ